MKKREVKNNKILQETIEVGKEEKEEVTDSTSLNYENNEAIKKESQSTKQLRSRHKTKSKNLNVKRRVRPSSTEVVDKRSTRKQREIVEENKEDDDASGDNIEDHEVEKIVGVKYLQDTEREFLIHWKGYPSEYDTWESEANLNCESLIEEFFEKHKKSYTSELNAGNTKNNSEVSEEQDNTSSASRTRGNTGKRSIRQRSSSSRRLISLRNNAEGDFNEENEEEVLSYKNSRRFKNKGKQGKADTRQKGRTINVQNKKRKIKFFRTMKMIEIKRHKSASPLKDYEDTSWEMKKNRNKENIKDVENAETEESKDSDLDYEVERIVDVHYSKDGTRKFLIKWKGFPWYENTWEPETNLNCTAKLNQFLRSIEKAPVMELRMKRKREHFKSDSYPYQRKFSMRLKKLPRKSYSEFD